MKKLTKTLTMVAASSCLLFGSAAMAASSDSASIAGLSAAEKKKIEGATKQTGSSSRDRCIKIGTARAENNSKYGKVTEKKLANIKADCHEAFGDDSSNSEN
jgi:hypothetical protein